MDQDSANFDIGFNSAVPGGRAGGTNHAVQFYEDDSALVDRVAEFAGSALGGGHGCIIVATLEHWDAFVMRLLRRGMDISQMEREGRLTFLDAAETLKLFMVAGEPNAELFTSAMDAVLSAANAALWASNGRLAIFGEMVALLWADGNSKAAIQLEEMWNELGRKRAFSLLCAYPIRNFGREEDQAGFRHICAEHTHVIPCESYWTLSDEPKKLRNVCELQQKAQMLQGEVARRKKSEAALRKCEEFKRVVN